MSEISTTKIKNGATPLDVSNMQAALALAGRGLGNVWPNPAVGCLIIDRDGVVVGRGWTQPGGRPHAETEALKQAGARAQGATAYVSLEPCDHHGQTPPCSQALIDAGVARVVVGCQDPDERVSGKGLRRLEAAGIEVVAGVCRDEAERLNKGFFLRTQEGRPLFTLKSASTLDGRIATHTGDSQWITGDLARKTGHGLRLDHDAIMVGIGTALVDNPMLTCRLDGLEDKSPVRIVFDSRLRLPLTHNLVATARKFPTWIVTLPGNEGERLKAFENSGVVIIEIDPDKDGYPDLTLAAHEMGRRGLTRVLIEGGSHLAASFLKHNLIDRVAWMRAPRVIGGDGIPAVMAFGVEELEQTADFKRVAAREAGCDLIELYER